MSLQQDIKDNNESHNESHNEDLKDFKPSQPEKTHIDLKDEIIANLKFIGHINRYEKINCSISPAFVQKDGLLTQISRTLYNIDNRQNNLNFLQTTVSDSFILLDHYINSTTDNAKIYKQYIISDLNQSILGLNNLKITYNSDLKFICDIDVIIESINAKLKLLE